MAKLEKLDSLQKKASKGILADTSRITFEERKDNADIQESMKESGAE